MTTFTQIEQSRELGRPYETYLFEYGNNYEQYYGYTNATEDMAVMGDVFRAVPIKRETYTTTAKIDKSTLNIRVPVNLDISRLYLDYPPPQEVVVTIRQHHYGDTETQGMVVWVGRVTSVAKERNEAILTCTHGLISLKRLGLRRRWQVTCPLQLYGPGCRADMQRATVQAEVLEVNQGNMVLPYGWWEQWSPTAFTGGLLRWMSEFGLEWRTIRSASDTSAAFVGPLRGIEPGMIVDLILGCAHNRDACMNIHDNIKNYGGQPFIPSENPTKYANFW